ncbi:hypothetical protein NUACC26_048610 [Scytonema sp. NUACC26]
MGFPRNKLFILWDLEQRPYLLSETHSRTMRGFPPLRRLRSVLARSIQVAGETPAPQESTLKDLCVHRSFLRGVSAPGGLALI